MPRKYIRLYGCRDFEDKEHREKWQKRMDIIADRIDLNYLAEFRKKVYRGKFVLNQRMLSKDSEGRYVTVIRRYRTTTTNIAKHFRETHTQYDRHYRASKLPLPAIKPISRTSPGSNSINGFKHLRLTY